MKAASGPAPAAPGAGSGASVAPSVSSPSGWRTSGAWRTLAERMLTTLPPGLSTRTLTRTSTSSAVA
eukprot:6203167-Lingulodinium_polyedra.AAC.1